MGDTTDLETRPTIDIRRLDDDRLIHATLQTVDPMSLEGICNDAPPAAAEFEMTYEAEYDVQCVFGHWRRKGIILRDDAGKRYPLGHVCGEQKYGVDWTVTHNALKSQIDRRDYLVRLHAIGNAIRQRLDWLSSLPAHPAVAACDELRADLAENFTLYPQVGHTARKDGKLIGTIEQRDLDAERRRRKEEDEEKEHVAGLTPGERKAYFKDYGVPGTIRTPIFTRVPHDYGNIPGAGLFVTRQPLAERLATCVIRFRALADTCLQMPATGDLTAISKSASALVNEFRDVLKEPEEAVAFFNLAELLRLVNWANSYGLRGFNFVAAAGVLQVEDIGERETKTISRPKGLTAIDASPLQHVAAAIGGPARAAAPTKPLPR